MGPPQVPIRTLRSHVFTVKVHYREVFPGDQKKSKWKKSPFSHFRPLEITLMTSRWLYSLRSSDIYSSSRPNLNMTYFDMGPLKPPMIFHFLFKIDFSRDQLSKILKNRIFEVGLWNLEIRSSYMSVIEWRNKFEKILKARFFRFFWKWL